MAPKAKTPTGQVFRVTRSFELFNEGTLLRAHEDDYIQSRRSAGLLRPVGAEQLAELEAGGQVVLDVTSAQGGSDGGPTLDGPNETGS